MRLGIWWLKGNLASSLFMDTIALTDPFILVQSIASGHAMGQAAIIGAVALFLFYFLVGGRVYCSWVCPINVVTDAAYWLRNKLKLNLSWAIKKSTRTWIMIMALATSAVTGTIAWEVVNPITMLQRGLVFGLGMAWVIVLAVFTATAFPVTVLADLSDMKVYSPIIEKGDLQFEVIGNVVIDAADAHTSVIPAPVPRTSFRRKPESSEQTVA